MNRTNLEKLATYLESLPADYLHFDMGIYNATHSRPQEADTPCGTVACAVGHGPQAGIPAIWQDGDWAYYAHRVFFNNPNAQEHIGGLELDMWSLLFSGNWATWDNTARGAAKRIRWLLAHPTDEDRVAQLADALVFKHSEVLKEFIKEYSK